jgi:hypothetical protein
MLGAASRGVRNGARRRLRAIIDGLMLYVRTTLRDAHARGARSGTAAGSGRARGWRARRDGNARRRGARLRERAMTDDVRWKLMKFRVVAQRADVATGGGVARHGASTAPRQRRALGGGGGACRPMF